MSDSKAASFRRDFLVLDIDDLPGDRPAEHPLDLFIALLPGGGVVK
jgi:hypothetical protein